MRPGDWLKLGLLPFLWGGAFYFSEVALDHSGPLTIVMARVTLAALVLAVFCRINGIGAAVKPALAAGFLVMGLTTNVIPFSLITMGQTQITGGLASIINASTPLFAVVVAQAWPGAEKATPLKISGVFAGVFGVAVLIGIGNISQPVGDLGGSLGGMLAFLAASLSYAVGLLYGRRFKALDPIFFSAGMLTASAMVMVPLALALETPFQPMPPPSALAAMAGLAVLASAITYFLYFSVLQSAWPTNASLVTFLVPASVIFLGVAFRSEVLEMRHAAGLGFILLGLVLVDGRLLRRRGRNSR